MIWGESMEIKKVKLSDGKEVEIYIEDDIKAYDINELTDDLEDTQELILDELKQQSLEDTMIFKGDE